MKSLSGVLSRTNDTFGLEIDEETFLGFDKTFRNKLIKLSAAFKAELEKQLNTDSSAAVDNSLAFFKRLNSLISKGTYFTFFKELRVKVAESLTDGFKTGFDKLKDYLGDLSFSDFFRLDFEQQKEARTKSKTFDALTEAINLPSLTPDLIRVLGKYN